MKLPRICLTFIITTMLLAMVLPAKAEDALRIVYNVGVAPLKFEDEAQRPQGLFPDIWRLWANKTGKKIQFVKADTFGESIDLLKSGQVHLHAGLFKTAEREKFLAYSEPILKLNYYVFTHPMVRPIASLEQASGLIIGIQRGGFTERLVRSKVPPNAIAMYNSFEDLFRAALRGEIKAFVSTKISLFYFLNKNRLGNMFGYDKDTPLFSQVYYTASSKENHDLIPTVNRGLRAIRDEERKQLEDKWIVKTAREIPADLVVLLTDEERDFLSKTEQITVHNEMDWAPFNFNEKGTPKGFSIDYMKLLAQKTGLEIQFVHGPSWDEFLEMMKSGKLDLMLNIAKSPEREQYLEFTPPYIEMIQMLYTRDDFPTVTSIEDLYGKRFAVPTGFYLHEVLKKYPEIEVVEVENTTEAIHAVSTGKADALFDLMPVVNYIIAQLQITNLKVGGELGIVESKPIPLHVAVRKDLKVLAGILEKGMSLITDTETRILRDRWLGKAAVSEKKLRLTNAERSWLKAHKKILLGTDPSWPPFERLDSDGHYTGIASCFVKRLNERLGIDMKPVTGLTWSQVLTKVKQRELDVIPCIARTPEREKYLLFTKPYLKFQSVIVTREDAPFISGLPDLSEKPVGVVQGYITHEVIARDYPKIQLKTYSNVEEGLRAVIDKDIAGFVDNLASITFTIRQKNLEKIKVASTTEYTFDLAFGVRPDWPELIPILEKGLQTITKEERALIHDRWINIQFEKTVDWGYIRKVVLIISAFAVCIIIVFVLWNRRLSKEIAERKETAKKLQFTQYAVDNAVDSVFWIRLTDGGLEYVNNAAIRELGYTHDELLRMHIQEFDMDFSPEMFGDLVDQLHQENSATFESRHQAKDGGIINVEVNTYIAEYEGKELLIASVKDITESKKAKDALAKAEERSRLLLESAGEGIFGVDSEGKTIFINPAGAHMLGYDAGELIGKPVHEMVHYLYPDGSLYPVEKCSMYAAFTEGTSKNVTDEVLWRKDKTYFHTEYNATPMKKDGRVDGAVITFSDITERKQAEEKLRQNMEDLERFSKLAVGREKQMVKLKTEINSLLAKLGMEAKYRIVK